METFVKKTDHSKITKKKVMAARARAGHLLLPLLVLINVQQILLFFSSPTAVVLVVDALPSFASRIPGGHHVPCHHTLPGCNSSSSTLLSTLDSNYGYCQGLGHADCRGGMHTVQLNAFGAAFAAAAKTWTRELCEQDSDGDGFTNGEELGDPCCMWNANDAVTGDGGAMPLPPWPRSHPGFASNVPGVELKPPNSRATTVRERWACPPVDSFDDDVLTTSAAITTTKSVEDVHFNPGETRRRIVISMGNVTVPCDLRTTYVDVTVNLPDDVMVECAEKKCLIVAGETVVDSPRLHHFVVRSCPVAIAPNQNAVPVVDPFVRSMILKAEGRNETNTTTGNNSSKDDQFNTNALCDGYLGAWAPGADPFITSRRDSGFRLGGDDRPIRAITVQAHYDNFDKKCGTIDDSVVIIHYTVIDDNLSATNLRPLEEVDLPFTRISVSPTLTLPPNEDGVFISTLCQIRVHGNASDDDAAATTVELERAWFHGHLVANAMYARIYRKKNDATAAEAARAAAEAENITALMNAHELVTPIVDMPAWWFDDQAMTDIAWDAANRYRDTLTGMLSSTRAALDERRKTAPTEPLPSYRQRLLLRDGDIVHSVCAFNTSTRDEPTTIGVQTIDEMCWSTATFVTAVDARAHCAPLQVYLGVLGGDDNDVDRIWERAEHGVGDVTNTLGRFRNDKGEYECTLADVGAIRSIASSLGEEDSSKAMTNSSLSRTCWECLSDLVSASEASGIPQKFANCFHPGVGQVDSATRRGMRAYVLKKLLEESA